MKKKPIISYEQAMNLPKGQDVDVFVESETFRLRVKNGIAELQNGQAGVGHSVYASSHSSGSLRGMKEKYWGKNAKTQTQWGYHFKIDGLVYNENCKWDLLCLRLSTAHL